MYEDDGDGRNKIDNEDFNFVWFGMTTPNIH